MRGPAVEESEDQSHRAAARPGEGEVPAAEKRDRRAEKRERFLRVAEKRTQAVLQKLQVLSKCGNPAVYDYDDHQVDQIFEAVEEGVRAARAKFNRKRPQAFRLR